jgi:hypothetical protein
MACPVLQYLKKSKIFEKDVAENENVFKFSLQILFETFLNPRRTEPDMVMNVYWSSREVPVIFVAF